MPETMTKIEHETPEHVDDAPVIKLPDDAEWDDLQVGVSYLAHVNGIEGYGIFVSLTPNQNYGVGGLVHNSDMDLFARSHEFTDGAPVIVTPVSRRSYDEAAYRLVDTLWNKDLDDVELTRTYEVEGYPSLGVGEEVEAPDGSDDAVGTLGAKVDEIENLDSVGETISLSDDGPVEPGKVPEPNTKLSLVLRAVGWLDGAVTSRQLNDRLGTTNSSRQLLDLWDRNLLERHEHGDVGDVQYEYTLNEHGEDAAEAVAEHEERTADDYPSAADGVAPDDAQERTADADDQADTDTMTEAQADDGTMETEPDDQMAEDTSVAPPSPAERSLNRALDVVEDSLRDGYDIEDVSLDMDHESVEVSVRLEVGDDV